MRIEVEDARALCHERQEQNWKLTNDNDKLQTQFLELKKTQRYSEFCNKALEEQTKKEIEHLKKSHAKLKKERKKWCSC